MTPLPTLLIIFICVLALVGIVSLAIVLMIWWVEFGDNKTEEEKMQDPKYRAKKQRQGTYMQIYKNQTP